MVGMRTVFGLTCAWVKRTRLFRRCARGNCMGFESGMAQAPSPGMPVFRPCPMFADAAVLPISRETVAKLKKKLKLQRQANKSGGCRSFCTSTKKKINKKAGNLIFYFVMFPNVQMVQLLL